MEYMILDVGGDSYSEKGESQLQGFEGKIEILSYSWNISNPIQSSPSNTGRTTGRPNFGELVISKKLDLTSPLFAFSCGVAHNLDPITLLRGFCCDSDNRRDGRQFLARIRVPCRRPLSSPG